MGNTYLLLIPGPFMGRDHNRPHHAPISDPANRTNVYINYKETLYSRRIRMRIPSSLTSSRVFVAGSFSKSPQNKQKCSKKKDQRVVFPKDLRRRSLSSHPAPLSYRAGISSIKWKPLYLGIRGHEGANNKKDKNIQSKLFQRFFYQVNSQPGIVKKTQFCFFL